MLKLKEIHKSYQQGSQEFPILKGIDLHVKEGDFLAIMGPSGISSDAWTRLMLEVIILKVQMYPIYQTINCQIYEIKKLVLYFRTSI